MTASVSDVIKANPPAVGRKETLLRSRITPVFGGFFWSSPSSREAAPPRWKRRPRSLVCAWRDRISGAVIVKRQLASENSELMGLKEASG